MKLRGARDRLATFKSSNRVLETHYEQDDLLSHPGTLALDGGTQHVKFYRPRPMMLYVVPELCGSHRPSGRPSRRGGG